MAKVYKIEETPIQNIGYGKLKKGVDTNIMPLYVNDENQNQHQLYVQIPKVQIQTNLIVENNIQKFMDVQSTDESMNEEVRKIENKILSELKLNKDQFFPNKGIDDIFLEAGQTSCISKDGVCKCRIMKDVQVWNYRKQSVDVNTLTKGKTITCILHVVGVWFTTSRWGVTLKVVQVRHEKEKIDTKLDQYMFPDEDENEYSEEEDEQTILSPPPCV